MPSTILLTCASTLSASVQLTEPVRLSPALRVALMIAGSVLALFVAVVICVLLARWLLIWYRKTLTVEKVIRIENQGNTPGVFRLKAQNPKGRLAFAFLHDGIRLANVMLPVEHKPETRVVAPEPAKMPEKTVAKEPAPPTVKKNGKVKKVQQKSKAAVGMGRQIGALIGSIGNFLPGSIGKGLKEKASTLQNATQSASRVIAAPDQKKIEAQQIQAQSKRLFGRKPKEEAGVPPPKTTSQSVQSQGEVQTEEQKPGTNGKRMARSEWVQTPPVPPGQVINLRLQINPVHLYQAGAYTYRVEAYQPAQPEAGASGLTEPFNTGGEVKIKGISNLRGALYFLMLLVIVGINGFWLIAFINWYIRVLSL